MKFNTRAHRYSRYFCFLFMIFFMIKMNGMFKFLRPTTEKDVQEISKALNPSEPTKLPAESVIEIQDVRAWKAPENPQHEILDPCGAESEFVRSRIQKTNTALIDFLAEGDEQLKKELEKKSPLPLVAGCGSGGGFRAMYSFSGALEAFERSGLLNSTLFLAALSGSTWALGPWIASGQTYKEFSGGFLERINQNKKNFDINIKNLARITTMTLQSLDAMKAYAQLLQKTLFVQFKGEKKQADITLKTLQDQIKTGEKPLPIFTAIISPAVSPITHLWCDMTPYEVSCYGLRAAVDPDNFGGYFNNKAFITKFDPITLTQTLTICGSAFAVTGKENEALNKYLGKNMSDKEVFEDLKKPVKIDNAGYFSLVRYAKFIVNNIAYNAMYKGEALPYNTFKTFPIVDAGIDCNIPLHPLLQRDRINKLGCIIVIDASGDLPDSFELLKAKLYAERNGLRFPNISQEKYPHYKTDPFTLFGIDENAPLVLYIPIARNPLFDNILGAYHTAHYIIKKKDKEFTIKNYKKLLKAFNKKPQANKTTLNFVQSQLHFLINAKDYLSKYNEEESLIHAINLVNRMSAFMKEIDLEHLYATDNVSNLKQKSWPSFLGTFNFDYSYGQGVSNPQVNLLRDTFIVALYQALPAVRDALLDRIGPNLKINRDKRRLETIKKEKQKLEEEAQEKNIVFEDFVKVLDKIAEQ